MRAIISPGKEIAAPREKPFRVFWSGHGHEEAGTELEPRMKTSSQSRWEDLKKAQRRGFRLRLESRIGGRDIASRWEDSRKEQ